VPLKRKTQAGGRLSGCAQAGGRPSDRSNSAPTTPSAFRIARLPTPAAARRSGTGCAWMTGAS